MKIEIVAKNYSVNEKLNDTLSKKIDKLNKFFEDDAKCRVYLKVENRESKMEIAFDYRGSMIRAEAKADNFYDAIDIIIPKLEKQIAKHRTKLESRLKKGSLNDFAPEIVEDDKFKLVKTKQFELTPMSLDDAISDFELQGFSFYAYYDIDDKKVKVLYLRDDGNVGLIDPIIAR